MSAVAEIIKIAKAEVGYHEGRSGGHWNNKEKYAAQVPGLAWVSDEGQPWCATFVSWVVLQAGVAEYYPRTASTDAGAAWFKARNGWSTYPAIGAQVFYGHNGDMSHTGLVYDYDADYIYTVEGNTNTDGSAEGDGVYLKKRARRDAFVQGYGYPALPEGLKSADPKYKAPATAKPADKPAAKPAPKPAAPAVPTVSLANVIDAAKKDPKAAQGKGAHPADTKVVEAALKAEGLLDAKYASDGAFGTTTVAAYKAWQKRCGYSGDAADGIPGHDSLFRLGQKHGFKVA